MKPFADAQAVPEGQYRQCNEDTDIEGALSAPRKPVSTQPTLRRGTLLAPATGIRPEKERYTAEGASPNSLGLLLTADRAKRPAKDTHTLGHRLSAAVAARQRWCRQRGADRQDRLAARRHLLHLPAGSAALGSARQPHRRRYQRRHGNRARRHLAGRQGAGALSALVHVPDRRTARTGCLFRRSPIPAETLRLPPAIYLNMAQLRAPSIPA